MKQSPKSYLGYDLIKGSQFRYEAWFYQFFVYLFGLLYIKVKHIKSINCFIWKDSKKINIIVLIGCYFLLKHFLINHWMINLELSILFDCLFILDWLALFRLTSVRLFLAIEWYLTWLLRFFYHLPKLLFCLKSVLLLFLLLSILVFLLVF